VSEQRMVGPVGVDVSAAPVEPGPGAGPKAKEFVGRSPGQLAWLRLRRDKVGMVSGGALLFFILLAAAAPLVQRLYGTGPQERFTQLLDRNGNPLGYAGGISLDHWLGLQPRLGRDIFIQLVYGLRTSLMVAFVAAVVTIVLGILIGIVAGYLGGKVDAVISWLVDLTLAFPFYIFTFAFVPITVSQFYGPRDQESPWFRPALLVLIFAIFNWTYTARLVRGQVLSLRALITAEAALSFLGTGILEPTPDLGRLISDSVVYIRDDPTFTLTGGITLFLLVLAFNLFGDSLRDALDPKSTR
jgi:peptide/nickel transport system permease protein